MALPLAAPLANSRAQGASTRPPVPAEVQATIGPQAQLRGSARLRWFGLSVYDARLWVGESFQPLRFDASAFALELIYARSLEGPLIAERSIDEMQRGGPLSEDQAQRWLSFMKEAFPDVGDGDRITGAWDPARTRSSFYVNGRSSRALSDPGFGPRFFGIWLAPYSSQPAMRQQLLGLSS